MKLVKLSINMGFIASLMACGGVSDQGPGEGMLASCVPIEMSLNESATYGFTKGEVTTTLTATVSQETDSAFVVTINQQGEVHSITLSKNCQDQDAAGQLVLTAEEDYILLGGSLTHLTQDSMSTLDADAAPPIDWLVNCDEQLSQIDVPAGTFTVSRCVMTTSDSQSPIRQITRFNQVITSEGDEQPFSGNIKTIVDFMDDTQVVAELLEWNGL